MTPKRFQELRENPEIAALSEPPTAGRLTKHWQSVTGQKSEALDGPILGTFSAPSSERKFIVSLDLDEVVRETCKAISALGGLAIDQMASPDGNKPDYGLTTLNLSQESVIAIVQEIIHEKDNPVDGIEEINEIVHSWRRLGAYCIANTSTQAGCELATVEFLQEFLPDAVDGIVFPRNWDGRGQFTKADAIKALHSKEIPVEQKDLIFIDDSSHHAGDALSTFTGTRVYMPNYTWNSKINGPSITRAETPIELFREADSNLRLELLLA